jgi:hypothetical protein
MNKHNYTDLIKGRLNKINELEGFDKRWLKYGLYTLTLTSHWCFGWS